MQGYIGYLIAGGIAFAAGMVLYWIFIPVLRKVKLGQTILEIGPAWHKSKEGTPNMGGVFFIAAILISFFITVLFIKGEFGGVSALMLINMGFVLANALIGFADDYVKLFKKRNKGLSASQKLILQVTVAAAYLGARVYFAPIDTVIHIPFSGTSLDLGAFYYIIALISIVYVINCANLTDGIDGLAGSIATVIAVLFFCVAEFSGYTELSLFQSAIIGGLLAFLAFNFHPAKIFMGDCGSLFLGAVLVSAVAYTNSSYLIYVAGLIYVLEGLSVIIQVFSYKTRKKRVFKMAPIHHHFEMCGWSEVKIVGVFSLLTALFSALCYFLYINGAAGEIINTFS